METTILTPDRIAAVAQTLPPDGPIFMLNLLRYKEQADYGQNSDLPPISGRDAYHQRYRGAFSKIAEGASLEVAWFGAAHAALVAPPGERWDDMAIIRYPDFATFRRLVDSDRYRSEADPHRRAALADWRLIPITKLG